MPRSWRRASPDHQWEASSGRARNALIDALRLAGAARRCVTTRASPLRGAVDCVWSKSKGSRGRLRVALPWWRKACRSAPIRRRCIPFEKPISSYWLSITARSRRLQTGLAVSSSSREFGVTAGGSGVTGTLFHDETHPYIGVAMDQCIHCDRCIRICDELQGQFVWEAIGRGDATYVAPGRGRRCWRADASAAGPAPIPVQAARCSTSAVRSTCRAGHVAPASIAAVGCQMEVGASEGRIVAVRPADSL